MGLVLFFFFFFAFLWTETKNAKKRTCPISSHLDLTLGQLRIYISYLMVFSIIRADILQVTSNEQNVRAYYMQNHRIRDLLFHYQKILLFSVLFSGKSIEIRPALSVHQYMARANDVNNTESH